MRESFRGGIIKGRAREKGSTGGRGEVGDGKVLEVKDYKTFIKDTKPRLCRMFFICLASLLATFTYNSREGESGEGRGR